MGRSVEVCGFGFMMIINTKLKIYERISLNSFISVFINSQSDLEHIILLRCPKSSRLCNSRPRAKKQRPKKPILLKFKQRLLSTPTLKSCEQVTEMVSRFVKAQNSPIPLVNGFRKAELLR